MSPTLRQAFLVGLAAMVVLLVAQFLVVFDGSRRSVLELSDQVRKSSAEQFVQQLDQSMNAAQRALVAVEDEVRAGAVDVNDPSQVERVLFSQALHHTGLDEVTLTRADRDGFDPDGSPRITGPRWQMSVYRMLGDDGSWRIASRYAHQTDTGFVFDRRVRGNPPRLDHPPFGVMSKRTQCDDPTAHLTFLTPSREGFQSLVDGREGALWTDLHYSELDAHLPAADRRVVVTVMKSLQDADGHYRGILRAGLLASQLDAITMTKLFGPKDPHHTFLIDDQNRLITRLSDDDSLTLIDDAIRVPPETLPAEISAALRHDGSGRYQSGGRDWLVTYRPLEGSQDWRLVIVVPEAYYTASLTPIRNRLVGASLAVMIMLMLGGGLALQLVQRGLGRIVSATEGMQHFDFTAGPAGAPFRDVREVLESLEKAKTALRAMGRYVPIDLVHTLFERNIDPVLGGETREVSLMFTDIAGFTSIAEKLDVDELAEVLGRYLEVMTVAVHECEGTIDKYIGDAVMALWNAPTQQDNHAERACHAALACQRASNALPEPALVTRFGLHTGEVMVGHFGAPSRMSYTVLGDPVNLAARLEGLNKQYGTHILASDAMREAAGDGFSWRFIDIVAVKGKSKGVRVYELLGPAAPKSDAHAAYEEAMQAYLARDFAAALATMQTLTDDPPARVLAARCRHYLQHPPPDDWDGIYTATTK